MEPGPGQKDNDADYQPVDAAMSGGSSQVGLSAAAEASPPPLAEALPDPQTSAGPMMKVNQDDDNDDAPSQVNSLASVSEVKGIASMQEASITVPPSAVEEASDRSASRSASILIGAPSSHVNADRASWTQQGDEQSSTAEASAPVPRRSVYKRRSASHPKGILKPAPPPQKGFSFRRDILQNINTRLAQQGVNVQVPVPQGGTAQATASYIGGVFRKISGLAAGAAANVGGSGSAGSMSGYLSPEASTHARPPNDSGFHSVHRQSTISSVGSDQTSGGSLSAKVNASSHSDATLSAAPLKKVQFQVSNMTVTYPIVGSGTPEDEDLTRIRIEREHRKMLRARRGKKWTPEELESLYRDCCRTREEHPLKKMRLVFQEAAQAVPPGLRTMDLSFVPLDRQAVEPIADLLSVDFGLTKLVLETCSLTDGSLKSILHALLVSGTLPNLSLASNRKIRLNGWKYVAIFMRRAQALRYLDLSENSINKASLEHILQAIVKPIEAVTTNGRDKAGMSKVDTAKVTDSASTVDNQTDEADYDEEGEPLMPTAPLLRQVSDEAEPPASAVVSLRLENCGLKTAALEMLARAVRLSEVRHLSLRRNGINQLGMVALALLLKDYPDSSMAASEAGVGVSGDRFDASTDYSNPEPHKNVATSGASHAARQGRPREVDSKQSYDRRDRSYSPSLPNVPVITSSPAGGFTSRRMPSSLQASGTPAPAAARNASASVGGDADITSPLGSPSREMDARLTDTERIAARRSAGPNQTEEEAMAIYRAKWAKRILADLPRVGNLLTLDLKSNDIRGGVVYLAQALKKNRSLRVLNLSDNQIEMPGLVAIAEALKYNSTLETLDLSHNPCSGPGLEGITTLRTAFTLNSNLKRLFLNGTDLSSEGAIALAEFLPEAKSLIHLDLAENFDIDIAGVMALAVSVRMNKSLRCLDLNIPPNNPDFARLSQEILQSCIRNTELAQQKATQKGLKQPIAAPIYKSVVARAAREQDERLKAMQAAKAAEEQAALAAEGDKRKAAEELLAAAQECRNVLRDLLEGEEQRQREAPEQKVAPPGDFVGDLTKQSKSLQRRLGSLATAAEEGSQLEQCLALHDELSEVTTRLEKFYRYAAAPLGDPRSEEAALLGTSEQDRLAPPVAGSELSSPTFSIADSDDSDDGSEDQRGSSRRKGERATSGVVGSAEVPDLEGLRIESVAVPTADREEPDDDEMLKQADEKQHMSPSGLRAKGQLSEEGELFRKAKSLGLDSEADSDDGNDALPDESQASIEGAGAGPSTEGTGRRRSSSASSSASGGSDGVLRSRRGSVLGRADSLRPHLDESYEISGEELRKDLLVAELPPKVHRSKEELAAAERGNGVAHEYREEAKADDS